MKEKARLRNAWANSMVRVAARGLKPARRVIVAVVGGTMLLLGLALVFLPGPAVVVIPLGLAILATEFVWARRLLQRVKQMFGSRKKAGAESPQLPQASEPAQPVSKER